VLTGVHIPSPFLSELAPCHPPAASADQSEKQLIDEKSCKIMEQMCEKVTDGETF
jgi:hypothetical protein